MSETHSDTSSSEHGTESTSKGSSKMENWINKIIGYVTSHFRRFVAFMFFVFTIGAGSGILIMHKAPQLAGILVLAPAIMGLLAYYNTTIAVILFVLFGILIYFL